MSEQITDLKRAVEHGGYLADSAEHLLDCLNKLHKAMESGSEEAYESAECSYNEAFHAVRTDVYEFRKRGVRCGVLQEKPECPF